MEELEPGEIAAAEASAAADLHLAAAAAAPLPAEPQVLARLPDEQILDRVPEHAPMPDVHADLR